jgi:two-component system chemotaxis response regulator CheB
MDFPVVCIGGSAGGLNAYIPIFKNLPAKTGMAFIVVNHMRTVPTQLHKVLLPYTSMPVTVIDDGVLIEPDCIFIIPSDRDLHVLNGEFRLSPLSKPRGWPDVITLFLRSLKKNWKGKIIAIIVSGLDSDGAAAFRDIKEVGGITIAQRLDTAHHPDMPRVRSKVVIPTLN